MSGDGQVINGAPPARWPWPDLREAAGIPQGVR